MIEKFLQTFSAIEIDSTHSATQLAELKSRLPGRQARRMSPLGVLVASVLAEIAITPESVLIYATTFTESLALESYLDSFPHASPTHFQTSIHPGGIEQALILNQQSVAALYPLAGKEDILTHALQLACTDARKEVIVVAGEEAGTWLTEMGVAMDRSFAYALRLTQTANGAMARVAFDHTRSGDGVAPSLLDLAAALREKKNLEWQSPGGALQWQWTKA